MTDLANTPKRKADGTVAEIETGAAPTPKVPATTVVKDYVADKAVVVGAKVSYAAEVATGRARAIWNWVRMPGWMEPLLTIGGVVFVVGGMGMAGYKIAALERDVTHLTIVAETQAKINERIMARLPKAPTLPRKAK